MTLCVSLLCGAARLQLGVGSCTLALLLLQRVQAEGKDVCSAVICKSVTIAVRCCRQHEHKVT
jgi:hypothetical protein